LRGFELGGADLPPGISLDPFLDQRRFEPDCRIERLGFGHSGGGRKPLQLREIAAQHRGLIGFGAGHPR
jgi:hypothetical protein